jgi:hypothetical protein
MKGKYEYTIAVLRYCSGQTTLPYTDAPEPLGALYGLDRSDADQIAKEVHGSITKAGGNPLRVCRPMRPCDEARLDNAYTRRGLKAGR